MTTWTGPERVGPWTAVRRCFTHWADFRGRASRSEYWWVALLHGLLVGVLYLTAAVALRVAAARAREGDPSLPTLAVGAVAALLLLAVALGTLVPVLALTVRRLRDAGLPPLLVLVGLVPWVGGLVLALLLARPSAAPDAAPPARWTDRRPPAAGAPRPAPVHPADDGFAWGPVIAPPRTDDSGPAER